MQRRIDVWPIGLDAIAFFSAFFAGLGFYVALHIVLQRSQTVVTSAIVLVMIAYAVGVSLIPRLRVRLDQAGDNAYYLGLLFTLTSMAFALYEFSSRSGERSGVDSGVAQIISNFGIALATTIAGIFLRVLLHQMRVDPADVERMSRIELAEASKRVRANLDTLSTDLGQFHNELCQRSGDVAASLFEGARATVADLTAAVGTATTAMLESASTVHQDLINQTQATTELLTTTAKEAQEAIKRLKSVEAPPVALSKRLDKVAKMLESVSEQAEKAATVIERVATSADALNTSNERVAESRAADARNIVQEMSRAADSWSALNDQIVTSRDLITELKAGALRSTEEAAHAQEAAVDLLQAMSNVARALAKQLDAKSDAVPQ